MAGSNDQSRARPQSAGASSSLSDLVASGEAGPDQPLKTHRMILEAEIVQAGQELRRPTHGLLVSGILAGIAVGTSLFVMAVILTATSGVFPDAVVRLLVANAFTIGFIVVVLSRIDLFTEYTTIAILPVLTGDATIPSLMRLWGLVYVGNLIGIGGFTAFIVALGPAMGVIEPFAFEHLADTMTAHGWLVTGGSGLLAGWLMGVLSWLVAAARDTISQIFVVWVVTFTIGLGQLHHSITGTGEVIAGILLGGTTAAELAGFAAWTTAGNALGGVLFAVLIRYSLVLRDREETSAAARREGDAARRSGERR